MPPPDTDLPYSKFNFRVKWEGRVISVSTVSSLKRTTEVVEFRDGGDPNTVHIVPGRTKYEPITLTRGLTGDTEFADWANSVLGSGSGAPVQYRKDITIDILDESGLILATYKVYRCWPSEYTAIDSLDARSDAIIIESLKLENEGWERVPTAIDPSELLSGS